MKQILNIQAVDEKEAAQKAAALEKISALSLESLDFLSSLDLSKADSKIKLNKMILRTFL